MLEEFDEEKYHRRSMAETVISVKNVFSEIHYAAGVIDSGTRKLNSRTSATTFTGMLKFLFKKS